jgi:hypothetical protein
MSIDSGDRHAAGVSGTVLLKCPFSHESVPWPHPQLVEQESRLKGAGALGSNVRDGRAIRKIGPSIREAAWLGKHSYLWPETIVYGHQKTGRWKPCKIRVSNSPFREGFLARGDYARGALR